MLFFEKGKFKGGDLMDIVNFDFDEVTSENWWKYRLKDGVFILEIPQDIEKMCLFNAKGSGLFFIPEKFEVEDEFYTGFWESKRTFVFTCKEQAMYFIKNYSGTYSKELRKYYKYLLEEKQTYDIYGRFRSLHGIYENKNEQFFSEIEDFIASKKLDSELVIDTLKVYILDFYRNKVKEENLDLKAS